jgi:hypothetical protein
MIKRLAVVGVALMAGCAPGYIKSSDLERQGQGPSACAKSCEDLGMRMTALVLVGDMLPGCVCQPVVKQGSVPAAAPAPAPAAPSTPESGAAASTTGFVVVAAAAAAAQQQQRQRQQQQQKH